jgi:acyl-CoA thioesterase FadM
VWGALDCPSYPAEAVRRGRFALLGRLTAHPLRPVRVGERLIAVGWTESIGNRSMRTASALLAGDEVVASARAVWVEAKADALSS